MKKIILFLFIIFALTRIVQADNFTNADRERLIRLETTLQLFMKNTDKRFEDMQNYMDKRFNQMFTFLWILTGIFTTLTLGVIGFAYWDRRTIIRKAREETIEQLEREGKLKQLIEAMRELAKTDGKVAEVLRQFHLL